MHLDLYTTCVFYIVLSYTATRSSAVLTTSAASNTPVVLAASVTSPSLTSSSRTKSNTTSHTTPRSHRPHTPSSRAISHSRPTSHPWTPPPATTSSPSQPSPHHLKPVAIAAIVLGGLVLIALLLCFARCGWSWHKTPRQDRIAGLLNRYNLEREMEEAAAEPLRAREGGPPPPPYFPSPPQYTADREEE